MYSDHVLKMFRDRVEYGAPTECWPWAGMLDHSGYGRLFDRENWKELRATHIALFLDGHLRPDEEHLACHTCDNPICVNPDHLWWGTAAENLADARAKGRLVGALGPNGKPFPSRRTPEMIQDALSSPLSVKQIAMKHGVSKRLIGNIRAEFDAPHRPSPIKRNTCEVTG